MPTGERIGDPDERATPTGLGAQSFDALVRQSTPALYRLALSLVRETQAAEDLVQDTFLRAFERRRQFRDESAPTTWLRRILMNLAIDRARRHPREELVNDIEDRWHDDSYTVSSEMVIERAETRQELEDALVRLPFTYRAVLLLHDVEGITVAQIAREMGIGLPAAKQRLRRGRMMLVSALAAGAERRAALHEIRKTPLSCGNLPGSNRRREPKHQPGPVYDVVALRQAIIRGCDRAFEPPPPLGRMKGETLNTHTRRLGVEEREELGAWRTVHRWHPYQLRHTAATLIRRQFGLEAAQLALGHSSALVTEAVYAERDHEKVELVMLKCG